MLFFYQQNKYKSDKMNDTILYNNNIKPYKRISINTMTLLYIINIHENINNYNNYYNNLKINTIKRSDTVNCNLCMLN